MQSNIERRASTQLKSWLKAVGIPFMDQNSYILVTKKDATQVPLCFTSDFIQDDRILINTNQIVNKKIQESLNFFLELQEKLGYEPKSPINRGPLPVGNSNDFNLVALRHHDLHKCPNPDPKKLKYYLPVINIAVDKFVRDNIRVLTDNSMDAEDVFSYANMWTINFIGLFELPARGDDQNKRLLMEYLKQRLCDFNQMLYRTQNMTHFLGDTYLANNGHSEEPDGIEDELELGKKESAALLDAKLNDLGHDEMVQTLIGVIKNQYSQLDAQKEAYKRLKAHSLICAPCKELELPNNGDLSDYNRPIVDQNGVIYENPNDAGEKLNLWASNIKKVLNGKYTQTGGYTFKYFIGNIPEGIQDTLAEPL